MGTSGDPQSILKEVSNLRQKYEECRASQEVVKGVNPKILAQYDDKNKKLLIEINRKNGVIKSLEQTMLLRDRSYRETMARNKSLIAQLHTQNVTGQEREMLKRALISVKGELALAQKELRGGSSSIVRMREELKTVKATLAKLQAQPSKVSVSEKIVTRVVEPKEKIQALQLQLNAANALISQLRNTPVKTPSQQPSVIYKDRIVTQEKIVYKDCPVEKVIEKIVYKDRPTQKEKVVEKVVYKDRIVTQEKVVYKDRPVEKVIEKIVYKDRPMLKEKVVEKIVYKDRPVEKVVMKTVIVEKPTIDENTRRKMDKLALELERAKTLNLKYAHDLTKTSVKRKGSTEPLPPLPPVTSTLKHSVAKTIAAPTVKKAPETVENTANSSKKSSGVYRMAGNASIYNAPNGRVIDTWEARRSFTGNSPANGWIHITGYFVNRVFQGIAEGENLWVKESDAIRR